MLNRNYELLVQLALGLDVLGEVLGGGLEVALGGRLDMQYYD